MKLPECLKSHILCPQVSGQMGLLTKLSELLYQLGGSLVEMFTGVDFRVDQPSDMKG